MKILVLNWKDLAHPDAAAIRSKLAADRTPDLGGQPHGAAS